MKKNHGGEGRGVFLNEEEPCGKERKGTERNGAGGCGKAKSKRGIEKWTQQVRKQKIFKSFFFFLEKS